MTPLQMFNKQLERVELDLSKVRGASPILDGWQTMRYAKKVRKWDMLGKEKLALLSKIHEYENECVCGNRCSDIEDSSMCGNCGGNIIITN